MNPAFFDAVRKNPFGGHLTQSAVDGINAICAAWEQYGDGDQRKLAYILGTALHECDRFRTMEEYASGAAYEGRRDLGNTQQGDGKRFKGRGFVQITGRRNYADWGQRLGLNLLAHPATACERPVAAHILVQGMMLGTFTGKKLSDYIGAGYDFIEARRIVNGTDKAALIAGYAKQFMAALQSAAVAAPARDIGIPITAPPAPLPAPPPVMPPDVEPAPVVPPVAPPKRIVAPAVAVGGIGAVVVGFCKWMGWI